MKETHCFTKENVEEAEARDWQRQELAEGLAKLRDVWDSEGWNIRLATCAEDVDLAAYDIEHNRCIDGELMERVFGDDRELVYYLHTGRLPEPDLFGELPDIPADKKNLKDKGQRKVCGCMTLAGISACIVMPIPVGSVYKRMHCDIRMRVRV